MREYFNLPASTVFRAVSRANTTGGASGRASTSARVGLNRASTGVTRPTTTTTAPTAPSVVRAPEDSDEPPPPPYMAEDPDPASTRILQEQLSAAAANTEGRPSSDAGLSIADTSSHVQPSNTSTHSGDAPRPNDFPATPAARVGNQGASSTGESSRPAGNVLGMTPPGGSTSGNAASAEDDTELSEEERRAREASELDEAMRASRAAEKERLEYEAAIQASLASAEEDSVRRSVQYGMDNEFGDTAGAGPSTLPASNGATPYGNNNSNEWGGSTQPSASPLNTEKPQPALPPQEDDPLADVFGAIDFNAPTLEPSHPDKGKRRASDHSASGLSRFQSNNPFLSVEERERQQAEEEATHTAARTDHGDHDSSTGVAAGMAGMAGIAGVAGAASLAGMADHTPMTPSTPPALPPRHGSWEKTHIPLQTQHSHSPLQHQHQQPAAVPAQSPQTPARHLPPPPREGTMDYESPSGPPPNWNGGEQHQHQHASPAGPPPGWQAPPMPGSAPHFPTPMPYGYGNNHTNEGHPQSPGLTAVNESHTSEERPHRPLPRPTGPPKLSPSPGVVNPLLRAVSNSSARGAGPENPYFGRSPPAMSPPINSSYQTPVASPSIAPTQSYINNRPLSSPTPVLNEASENALEMLADYDTVFLIDDSTSMAGERWDQAQKAVMGVVSQAMRYARNGVDCYFLNSKRVGKELRSPADVEDLFAGLSPRGATPSGMRMEAILRDYMTRLERSVASDTPEEVAPMNLIVVTDGGKSLSAHDRRTLTPAFLQPVGRRLKSLHYNPSLDRRSLLDLAPTDDPESVLVTIARRLDRGDFPLSQVGVQLLQIGDDAEVSAASVEPLMKKGCQRGLEQVLTPRLAKRCRSSMTVSRRHMACVTWSTLYRTAARSSRRTSSSKCC